MAEGRMLKKKISLNEALADLPSDTHRLLFTWGIAHLDVEGRITGSPKVFMALVVPLLDHITPEIISVFFHDAESKGLIQRYDVDGEWHIQYPKFAHNQNLTKSREAPSKRPAPPPDYSPTTQRPLSEDSQITQPEVKLIKENLSEENLEASAFVAGKADEAPPEENSLQKFKPGDLVDFWNELGCKPMVSELTDERRKKATLRIRKRNNCEWWRVLFKKVLGLNKPWLTFDFLINNDTNSLKVLEGNYDRDFQNPGDGRGKRPAEGKYSDRQGRHIVDLDASA